MPGRRLSIHILAAVLLTTLTILCPTIDNPQDNCCAIPAIPWKESLHNRSVIEARVHSYNVLSLLHVMHQSHESKLSAHGNIVLTS